MAFPTITDPSNVSEETYLPQIKNEFEANYVQSRPQSTRARKRFFLTWNGNLPTSEWDTLDTYFQANQGGSFVWTHTATDDNYTVRFADNSISCEYTQYATVITKLTLEEL